MDRSALEAMEEKVMKDQAQNIFILPLKQITLLICSCFTLANKMFPDGGGRAGMSEQVIYNVRGFPAGVKTSIQVGAHPKYREKTEKRKGSHKGKWV